MYVTYKTTNVITGEYYIGSHKTDNPNDDYLGSGRMLRKSIKEYGIEAHKKEVIATFDNREESIALEHTLIKEKRNHDSLCINMNNGGSSFDYINENLHFDMAYFGSFASHDFAKKQRIDNINNYYKNPNKCLQCGNDISYEKKSTNKFCSSFCAAKYNNYKRNVLNGKIIFCEKCGTQLSFMSGKRKFNLCRNCYIELIKNKEIQIDIKKRNVKCEKKKLLLKEKSDIIEKHNKGLSYRKIGEIYGVSGNYIKDLLKGRLE